MLDAKLVAAAIASRDAYERVAPHIQSTELTPAGGFWWQLIGEWYERDKNTRSCDLGELAILGNARLSTAKHRDTVIGFLRDLPSAVSADNSASIALELKRHNVGMELAAAIAAGDGKRVTKLHTQYGQLMGATALTRKKTQWRLAVPVEQLFDKVGLGNRIPLAPDRLNSRIGGGALPGHHIVIFGRPEIGKSTFALNLAAVRAVKGSRVLYVGNEDQIDILKSRAVSRVTNMSWPEIEQDKDRAIKLYRERGAEERLRFAQMSGGTADSLREQIDDFEPTVLVLDQIRNIDGGGDGLVQNLEANGQIVRKLLIEYALIGVSVAQAGGSAEGKLWLGMTDLDSSKTGLPGTADLMLGVGGNRETLAKNQRGILPSKNKLSSAADAHEGFLVEIDSIRSKVV